MKKRRPRTTSGFGQAVLASLRDWERSDWARLRRKIAVARRQLAEGKSVDGETAMNEIIALANGDGGDDKPRSRSRKPPRRRRA